MTKDDYMIHIRVDADNMKTAKARSKSDYRNNMTAYINALIREDASHHPSKTKSKK